MEANFVIQSSPSNNGTGTPEGLGGFKVLTGTGGTLAVQAFVGEPVALPAYANFSSAPTISSSGFLSGVLPVKSTQIPLVLTRLKAVVRDDLKPLARFSFLNTSALKNVGVLPISSGVPAVELSQLEGGISAWVAPVGTLMCTTYPSSNN